MNNEMHLSAEVQLVWEVMTCLGLRTTYDRPDSPCHWFNQHYGPYPAYSSNVSIPTRQLMQNTTLTIAARCKGHRFNVPEILSGCRKAPIMSIGINPNLTAYQHNVSGTTWCYPYFDDITSYANHFRNRTINQERFDYDFIKSHLVDGTQTFARKDGTVENIAHRNSNIALTVRYDDEETEVIRLPEHHLLLWDTKDGTNRFHEGDPIAGELVLPEDADTMVILEPVGYYKRFQTMIERFVSKGDSALRNSRVRLGEDASQGDMVACASPGWNAYFPDTVREGVVEECVRKRKYFSRQLIQSRPSLIVFSGNAALQMFQDVFKNNIHPEIDENLTTYQLLQRSLREPYWLEFGGEEDSHFSSRLVFSPHFSYGDSFDAGCRLSTSDWTLFQEKFPGDSERIVASKKKKDTFNDGICIYINPNDADDVSDLGAEARNFLKNLYIDPIDTIAEIMLDEYSAGRLVLDEKGEHFVRTNGPCQFCKNGLFALESGCRYDKQV